MHNSRLVELFRILQMQSRQDSDIDLYYLMFVRNGTCARSWFLTALGAPRVGWVN